MNCVRLAAVGDVHVGLDSGAVLNSELLVESADVLLVVETSHAMAHRRRPRCSPPKWRPCPSLSWWWCSATTTSKAQLAEEVRTIMESAGAIVLDGGSVDVELDGVRVGIAGTPGFGGGFRGASCSEFGEPLMKAFVRHSRAMADALCDSLKRLDTDLRIALTHSSDRGHARW